MTMTSSKASNAGNSYQEQREQKVLDVMFLCDEWKSSKGGLSTFNREFAINLAEATTGSMKIHCYVSNSDDRDREDAKQHGVNLITARSVPGSADPLEGLKFSPPELPNPHLVIGHGRKLGCPAYSLLQNTKCKWIQFVHVYCEDLGKYKDSATAAEDTIEENEKKHKMEIELCEAADAVVAVGSRLQQKYSRRLLNVEVKVITPGIFGKFSNESKLAVDRSVVKNFNVSVFGRAAFEDLSLKGYDIIANAIGSLGKNFELTFVGSSPGEQRKVEQWFLNNTCINRNQLTIRRYCSEQEELKVMFYQSDLVALPSRTEGFGLVALEAISAGIPVLVSGESGIAEALQKVEGGNTVIVGSGEDEDEWARRIREMYEESAEEREANAVKLRENYRKVYSWKAECERFKGLIEKVVENDQKLKIKVDVEHMKLGDHNAYRTASVSALEPAGYQKAFTASGTKRKRQSDKDLEDLQPLEKKVLCSIAMNYLNTTPPQSRDERNEFLEFLEKTKVLITGVSVGSLVITVKCDSLKSLEELWKGYSCGLLGKMVQDCFVTEKILKELNLVELKLKTTMDMEEYNACKLYFLKKDALRGASSSEFHSISSTSESPLKQGELKKWEQKTKIVETEKLKGTSPFTVVPTTGHGKELVEKEQRRKGMLPLHGSSTSDPEEKLEELLTNLKKQVTCSICLDTYTEPKTISCLHTFCCECLERHATVSQQQGKFRCPECQVEIDLPDGNRFDRLPNSFLHNSLLSVLQAEGHKGTSPSNVPFTAGHKKKWEVRHNTGKLQEKKGSSPPPPLSNTDLEEKLGKVCEEIKMLRMEGSSPPPVSTVEVELEELLKKLQKGRMEGSSSPPLVSTTDLEGKLGKVCEEIKMLRMEGSLPPPASTVEVELEELLEKLQKGRMEGALSSEFHSTSSTSPQKKEQWEKSEQKTKIMGTAKLEGTSPLTVVPTTGYGKELEEPWGRKGMLPLPGSSIFGPKEELVEPRMKLQRIKGALSSEFHSISSTCESPQNQEELKKRKQKTKIDEKGSFPVLKFSTICLEETLAALCKLLQMFRMEVTLPSPELLTADLEEKLKELLTELERQRDEGTLPPTFSTIEVEVDELLKKFQKRRMEGALSSEFHSTSSTSESPLTKEQWEKSEQQTKIMETAKLEGTSPLIVIPTTGHGKELEEPWGRKGMLPLPGSFTFDLEEKLEKLYMKLLTIKGSSSLPVADLKEKLEQVFEEIRMLRMEGSFSVLKLSTTDLEKKLAELRMKLQRLRVEGTLPHPELFTADLVDELEQLDNLIWILTRRKREKGSSHSLFFTAANVSGLLHELEKVKMEALENAMYPTIRSGLAKFDVSLPEELQNYVSYLLNESAKFHFRKQVFQPPRALEELREAMDKDELIAFLTIHIREVAWQVVLLFTDELPRVKLPRDWCGIIHNEDEDEEVFNEVIYSSTSGILNGWQTKYDPDLITLCKAITNRDWKVTRLILSRRWISDEGLKNLSTALPQSELYSLTLHGIGLRSQRLKYLCEALINIDCHLTTLNVSENYWGDEGIVYLCNALTSIDCTLTSLNVSYNTLGDEGIMHLCNALTSVNCRLTSLNASDIRWGDNGIKHLCDALTSSNCVLTKLKISFIRLGDGGIKELSEVLTNGFCTLTSLDIRGNEFGDEGIKHLCKALTDTNCKLQRLNLRANWNVTDEGEKYLSQMLTGTDWEVRGAQLSRSTTK